MTESKEDEVFVQPVLRNFTGHWLLDVGKSDSVEPLIKALGVNWLARKVLSRVEVTSVITHTPTQLTVVDKFSMGKAVTSVLVDRRYHKIYQGDKECRARARQDNDTGDMIVEIEVISYFSPNSHLGLAAAAAAPAGSQHEKPQTTVTRFFNKKETKEEVIANEEAEDRARERLERLGLTAWSWAATGTHPLGAARGGSSRAMAAGSSLSLSDVPITASSSSSSSSPKRVRFADSVSTAPSTPASTSDKESKDKDKGAGGSPPADSKSAPASAGPAESKAAPVPAAPAPAPVPVPGPLLCDLTGVWKPIKDRSDSLDQFFAELGVTWVARKVLLKLDVTTTIVQTPEWCSIMDQSSAGESTTKVKTDGNPQTITDAGGKEAVIVASLARDTGNLCQETLLPGGVGIILDERSLESRTVMKQITQVVKGGVTKVKVTRYFTKIEASDEERVAGEKKWEETVKLRAKVRAAESAAASAAASAATSKPKKADEASASPESRRRALSDATRERERAAAAGAGAASSATAADGKNSSESKGDSKSSGGGGSESKAGGGGGGHSPQPSLSDEWQDDEDPYLYVPDFSGRWQLQRDKSDDISPLLEHMGVPWFYRKIAAGIEVFSTIEHSRKNFTIIDQSSFGKFVVSVVPNDTWQTVKQYGGGEAKTKVVQDLNRDGAMRTETEYPGGKNRMIEIRRLLDRTTMRQVYTFLADGVSVCVVTRFFKRVETDQERALGELHEQQRMTRIELREARRKEKELAELEAARLLEAKAQAAEAAAAGGAGGGGGGSDGGGVPSGSGAVGPESEQVQYGHDQDEEDGNLAAQLCLIQ